MRTIRYKLNFQWLASLVLFFIFCDVPSVSAETIEDALKNGAANISFRSRYEQVDQDGIGNTADALTWRTRLTFTSQPLYNWQLSLEFDDVSDWINDYNSTANGKSQFPVIADPEGTDLNVFDLTYRSKSFQVSIGRQRINLGDQRFIGGVGWRQNEQTYDSLKLGFHVNSNFSLNYIFIHNVNRIFGPTGAASDIYGSHHVFHANYQFNKEHKLSVIGLLLEPDNVPAIASTTLGIDYTGHADQLTWHLAYASQSDSSDAPIDYSADYLLAEVSYKFELVKFGFGYEVLGSDNGTAAFVTPLATLHKFQGFADKFLNTPATGIEDAYLKVSGKLNKLGLSLIYHNFAADNGGTDYGDELDLVASYSLDKHHSLLFKYASYSADTFATDTDKLWLMFTAKY